MQNYVYLVLAMGLVTYLPRLLPLILFSRRNLPTWLRDWLELIPAAILSALITPILFTHDNPRAVSLDKPELLAAIPTLICALTTRSLAATVITGMLSYWLILGW